MNISEENPDNKQKESKSSCLIESLIIAAIIITLLVIVMPNIDTFDDPKARQSEAKHNLGEIFTAQVAYFAYNHTYAGGEKCFRDLVWALEGDNLYAYYCGDDHIENKKGTRCPVPGVEHGISDSGFTIMAVGNVDEDPECDVWIINDAKVLTNVVVDP
jgi:Tfp pilus assembly protein PilE